MNVNGRYNLEQTDVIEFLFGLVMFVCLFVCLFFCCFCFCFFQFLPKSKWESMKNSIIIIVVFHRLFCSADNWNLTLIPYQRETIYDKLINGSQLAKMKKYIPYMSPPWSLQGRIGWSKQFQLYFRDGFKTQPPVDRRFRPVLVLLF